MNNNELLALPRQKVDSSHLEEVGYHGPTSTLIVKFKGDSFYKYTPVTREGYEALIKADSVGKFFNINIQKNNLIEYKEIFED